MIVRAIIACIFLSALGAFGGPLLCRDSNLDIRRACIDSWNGASAASIAAATTLGTLLAKLQDPNNGNP